MKYIKIKIVYHLLIIQIIGLVWSQGVQACPRVLQHLNSHYLSGLSLCEVYTRFVMAQKKLIQQGTSSPDRIAEVLAPRFIDMVSWNTLKIQHQFNPLRIYEPAPETWVGWEKGKSFVDYEVYRNLFTSKLNPLSIHWIRKLHAISLSGLSQGAGEFRKGMELGMHFYRSDAITKEQIEEILKFNNDELMSSLEGEVYGFTVENRKQKMVSVEKSEEISSKELSIKAKKLSPHFSSPFLQWIPTLCYEEQVQSTRDYMEFRKVNKIYTIDLAYWPAIDTEQFFRDTDGKLKQCGYIIYVAGLKVQAAMDLWLQGTNSTFKRIQTFQLNEDVFISIAKMQRLFVAIHPFEDGNGRVSRFVMDLLIQSLGLPAPILADMNHDLDVNDSQWAEEIGKGVLRALNTLENCAQNIEREGCQTVPQSQLLQSVFTENPPKQESLK